MDMEERLEALAVDHRDAAAAYRAGETISDQLAAAWETEADYWLQEETAEEARERVIPDEQEQDRRFGERQAECGLSGEALNPGEKIVCDFCDAMQRREYSR